jgi:hypothetical protein
MVDMEPPPTRRSTVTRKDRAQLIDRFLDRYANLGRLLVEDDECLLHLLQALGVDTTDRDLGEYLVSFLTA